MIMLFSALLMSFSVQAQELCFHNYNLAPTSWVNDLNRIAQCAPLNAGDLRVIDTTRGRENPTSQDSITAHKAPNDNKYIIRRLGNGDYEMMFNLNFTSTPASPGQAASTTTPAAMLERVRNCMDIAAPALVGPNGERLRILAVSPTDVTAMRAELSNDETARVNALTGNARKRERDRLRDLGGFAPPQINVRIIEPGFNVRGNADHYGSDFNCGTIMHELLHYAGLCDEYREGSNAPGAGACRAFGPGDSLMGSGMISTFDDAVGEVKSCGIPAGSQSATMMAHSDMRIRELAMRRSHVQIGNRQPTDVGLLATDGEPKSKFCTIVNDTPPASLPTTKDGDYSRLLTDENEKIEIRSLFYSDSGTNVFSSTLKCDCTESTQPERCREYLRILRPEARLIATPGRKVYDCPVFEQNRGPSRFDVAPGTFVQEAGVVHYRNQPGTRSLLHAAHFERLIAGPCQTSSPSPLVSRYDQCAQFSVDYTQPGTVSAGNCGARPAFCNDPAQWLGGIPRR